MKKNKISSYFLIVSVFTLITLFLYVSFQSYSKLLTPIKEANANPMLKPINPQLDTQVLDEIEKRILY
ncbi:MAG TPA: hypothetical protein PK370_02060 [Candidatus Woesebacteria bacterium]|nr:hypothetical protein [Candidatus Woesebacteria bacterium]HPJ16738.1 hypothetical protein [Candidatus Woesebacteria bacterium]